jgi:ABC-2 type transport system ATP-binding protein
MSILEDAGGSALLLVPHDIDLAALVTAVRRESELVSFAYEPPTLSQLFREAVPA